MEFNKYKLRYRTFFAVFFNHSDNLHDDLRF